MLYQIVKVRNIIGLHHQVAKIYGLEKSEFWPKTHLIQVGDRLDKDKEMCRTNRNTTCDLTNTKCNLEAFEGYAYNIYRVIRDVH